MAAVRLCDRPVVVVRGVENLNLAAVASKALSHAGLSELPVVLTFAFGTGLGANAVNNVPMALIALSVFAGMHNESSAVYAALIGCNIGPNLTIIGSLATMLVITSARSRGEEIRGADFMRVGLIATPLTILAACFALWAENL